MKLNRFFGLAMIALLAIGGLGLASAQSAAHVQAAHAQQVQVTSASPIKTALTPAVANRSKSR